MRFRHNAAEASTSPQDYLHIQEHATHDVAVAVRWAGARLKLWGEAFVSARGIGVSDAHQERVTSSD